MVQPLDNMRVTCPFGWRRHPVTHMQHFHNGVDLAAVNGTPVRAPFSGMVTINRTSSGGNQLIIVNRDAGLRAGFAHLSRYADGVTDSSQVKEGQVVGYTGSSGKVTGPHLHYTLSFIGRGGKKYFDPERVVC